MCVGPTLMMEHVSTKSYCYPNEWKFVDTVKVNYLSPDDEKINNIKDFPVAIFSLVSQNEESFKHSCSPTIPNPKMKESSEYYTKVQIPIPYSDHHIFEVCKSDDVIKLLCIKKDGTQFEKILPEILQSEPLDDLKNYFQTEKSLKVYLMFIRPFPIENGYKQKIKSKAADITSIEEAESSPAETKIDMLRKSCKILLEKNMDKLKVSIREKPLDSGGEDIKEKKVHDPYTSFVTEERVQKATSISKFRS